MDTTWEFENFSFLKWGDLMLEEASSVGHVGEDVTITMVVVETSEDDGWSREIGGSVEEKKEAG